MHPARREALDNRRFSVNYRLEFQGETYDVTAGFYNDGRLGELFINRVRDKKAAKLGFQLDATCRDAAIMISRALQHGVDLAELTHSVTRGDADEPMSIVGAVIDSIEAQRPEWVKYARVEANEPAKTEEMVDA
jgi:ribonucleoside-diphosphate reductase alpha chain